MNGSTKTWFLLSIVSISVISAFHSWAGRQGLLWGVIISLSVNCLIYFYNEVHLGNLFLGQLIEGQNPWGLLDTVQKLAKTARIPVPKVVVLASPSPQAMVMGRSWNSATLYLTEGLLRTLSADEREAVIAYQISCIKKMDTLIFTFASAIVGVIFTCSRIIDFLLRGIMGAKADPNSRQNHLCSWLFAPIATVIVKTSIGSSRYLTNDATAASWLKDPKALAQALWKLDSYASTMPLAVPPSTAPLFVVNPLTGRGWTRYFHVHPSVEKRIRNIIGYYPI
jgi:heat shock protein HtpX